MTPALLRELQRQLDARKRHRSRRDAKRARRRVSFRPAIDPLEARHLLTTFTVLNVNDMGAGSLRQAILDANARPGRDSIEFAIANETITLTTGQLVITDDLTINGPGADKLTINGNGDRVFAIAPLAFAGDDPTYPNLYSNPTPDQFADPPTVKVEGLSIKGGVAANAIGYRPDEGYSFGGGIYNMGGKLHLNRVHMTLNSAVGGVTAGGAIANEFGGTLTVSRSYFKENSSLGFVAAVGGAITSDLGKTEVEVDSETIVGSTLPPSVRIDRSEFVGNLAQAGSGYVDDPMFAFSGAAGGGAVLNVTGEMTITRSHFEYNSVVGGAALKGSDALPDSTTGGAGLGGAVLSGNLSPFGLAESSLRVSNSTFKHNTATGGSGDVASGPDETAGVPGGLASGGAIALGNGTDARLERNGFYHNSVVGGAGGGDADGGIGTGGAVSASDAATLRLQRNRFVKNEAKGGDGSGDGNDGTGRGGALGLHSIDQFGFGKTTFPDGSMPFAAPATASSEFDAFYRNTAHGGIGGGIYNEGDLSAKGSRLVSNTAEGLSDVAIDFVPGYTFLGAALGGGISNVGTLEIKNATLMGNEAVGANDTLGANFLTDGFGNYPGLGVGGGLHNIGQATIKNSHFKENGAIGGNGNEGSFAGVGNGGGIYNDGALELQGSSVRHNIAQGGDGNKGDLNAGGGYGGGIASGSVTYLNILLGGEGRDASLHVERSSIMDNAAVGGVNNTGPDTIGIEISTPLAHKPSGGIGGGILVYQGTASISKAEIVGNRAEGNDSGAGAGGGVFFFGFVGYVNAEVSKSTVAHNTAIAEGSGNALGGGIAIGSLGSILSTGLFIAGDPAATNVMVGLDRTEVTCNRALGGDGGDGLGGGIFNGYDADTKLKRSTVKKNEAIGGGSGGSGVGGGVYNEILTEDIRGEFDAIRSRIFANWASTSDDDCANC